MMRYDKLRLRCDEFGIVHVTLNRPHKRNALCATTIAELHEVAQSMGRVGQSRAMVLCGAGKMFCAGADLAWMQAQMATDRAGRMAAARRLAAMLQALNTMEVPLIGRLHGGVFGGGIGLAAVCDVVVASPDTRFCCSETRLGLIPATIGPYVLARIGEAAARCVMLSGHVFSAQEACDFGLVTQVVAQEDLDATVEAEVRRFLGTAPGAVAATKPADPNLGCGH